MLLGGWLVFFCLGFVSLFVLKTYFFGMFWRYSLINIYKERKGCAKRRRNEKLFPQTFVKLRFSGD